MLSLPLDLVSMGQDFFGQALGKITLQFVQFFREGFFFGDLIGRPGQACTAFLAIIAAVKIEMTAISATDFKFYSASGAKFSAFTIPVPTLRTFHLCIPLGSLRKARFPSNLSTHLPPQQ
jgi:hypothetical protein